MPFCLNDRLKGTRQFEVSNFVFHSIKKGKKYCIKSFREYLIERFSAVLNVQHCYSIFLLIDEFYLIYDDFFFKFTNEQRLANFDVFNWTKNADFKFAICAQINMSFT